MNAPVFFKWNYNEIIHLLFRFVPAFGCTVWSSWFRLYSAGQLSYRRDCWPPVRGTTRPAPCPTVSTTSFCSSSVSSFRWVYAFKVRLIEFNFNGSVFSMTLIFKFECQLSGGSHHSQLLGHFPLHLVTHAGNDAPDGPVAQKFVSQESKKDGRAHSSNHSDTGPALLFGLDAVLGGQFDRTVRSAGRANSVGHGRSGLFCQNGRCLRSDRLRLLASAFPDIHETTLQQHQPEQQHRAHSRPAGYAHRPDQLAGSAARFITIPQIFDEYFIELNARPQCKIYRSLI